ncbi:copper resistance protein NlpE [Vibrio campbellii]|uniref:copper resistance protein NlpE n=1 Tax=Vibrio campbellii TaxID=680 RepID=UPI001F3C5059|nr:copper resistance protein NlpE [Vibrio campbellii]MCE7733051.1 copper resistance protein NlpE N-terminal domain-containing protein [Vibrio campbellii]
MNTFRLLLLSMSVALMGCQDEKPQEASVDEAPLEIEADSTLQEAPLVAAIDKAELVSNEQPSNQEAWSGTFTGTLPCADCPGIDTTLVLSDDNTYTLEQHYQEKGEAPIRTEGLLSWNDTGDTVTLLGEHAPNQYHFSDMMLTKLDMNGEKITGDLAELYQLSKHE